MLKDILVHDSGTLNRKAEIGPSTGLGSWRDCECANPERQRRLVPLPIAKRRLADKMPAAKLD